jgi:hypothetical protein
MPWLSSVPNFPVANSRGVSSSTCCICPAAEAPDTIGNSKAYYLKMTFRQLIKRTNGQERCHVRVWRGNFCVIKALRFEVGLLKIQVFWDVMLCFGWVVCDISKDCSAFVFRTAWCRRWEQCSPSEPWKLLPQWHSFRSQKAWNLIMKAV